MRLKAENALAADTSDQASALRLVLTQVERLERVVRSLLLASKPLALDVTDVNVECWLGEHLGPLNKRLDAAQITLKVECNTSTWRFDPVHLGRALENLLDNAVTYTKPGGTIHVTAATKADTLLVRVADDGPGVAADVRARLFEPFATGRADGTGLGLMIVREIAKAHGGDARLIDSSTGAVFEIEIPWRTS
jgi:signal transduction histidine kinase